MLYNQKEVEKLLEKQLHKFIVEIIKNNSKCQNCVFYHPCFGEGTCFLAFPCLTQNFKSFIRKDEKND